MLLVLMGFKESTWKYRHDFNLGIFADWPLLFLLILPTSYASKNFTETFQYNNCPMQLQLICHLAPKNGAIFLSLCLMLVVMSHLIRCGFRRFSDAKLTQATPAPKVKSKRKSIIPAMKKLVVLGTWGIILSSSVGILENHYKDPYKQPVKWKVRGIFFKADLRYAYLIYQYTRPIYVSNAFA